MRIVLYLALTSNGPPRIKLTLKPNISTISVNSARKPEGVGVRGQGKVAFSHALWLPLPREQSISPSIIRQQGGSLPNFSLQKRGRVKMVNPPSWLGPSSFSNCIAENSPFQFHFSRTVPEESCSSGFLLPI